jgi:hypothetical protein
LYTQIGGLCVATFITLLLVPVLYAIFVLDLKILKWERQQGKLSVAMPRAVPEEKITAERLTTFSDAVFTVIVTAMVTGAEGT